MTDVETLAVEIAYIKRQLEELQIKREHIELAEAATYELESLLLAATKAAFLISENLRGAL